MPIIVGLFIAIVFIAIGAWMICRAFAALVLVLKIIFVLVSRKRRIPDVDDTHNNSADYKECPRCRNWVHPSRKYLPNGDFLWICPVCTPDEADRSRWL